MSAFSLTLFYEFSLLVFGVDFRIVFGLFFVDIQI